MNKKAEKLFDKMTDDFKSEFEVASEINMYEFAGEGTWLGWTYLHTITRFDLEEMRKMLVYTAEQCFFDQYDSLEETLKERKEEILESSKEIDKLTEEIRKLTENEKITELLDAIDQVGEEMEESLRELNF